MSSPSIPDAAAPFAGFWRRVAAFVVDSLILGSLGYAFGLAFSDAFARLGAWGRVLGFAVALAYFVPQESARGGGQSLGKRLLRIRVVDAQGLPPSLARGTARFAVFGVPYFINGAALPMDVAGFAGGVPFAVLALGGMLALAYLLVFNRRTRQSLHDLAVGAFVVRVIDGAQHAPGSVRAWRGHLAIAGLLVALAAATPLLAPQLTRVPTFAGLWPLYARLAAQPGLRAVNVSTMTLHAYGRDGASEHHELSIQAVTLAPEDGDMALAVRLAGIALANYPAAASEEMISVRIARGFDIGIASNWRVDELRYRPEQWADRVAAGLGN
jgi:uncharacterized RDD family membrane protein YckC